MNQPNTAGTTKIMDYFTLAIGAYLFYGGIRGKGDAMFRDDAVHCSKKREYHKVIRLFGLVGGPICAGSAILTLNNINTPGYILMGVFGAMVLGVIIYTLRVSDRHIKKRCAKLGVEEPASDGLDEEREAEKPKPVEAAPVEESEAHFVADESGASRKVEKDDIRFF